MTLKELREMSRDGMSDEAINVIDNVIDNYEKEEDDEEDVYDNLWNECDEAFIYYSDAFRYLEDNNITDFSEAINEFGCKNVCSIACYYLMQELGIC